MKRCHRMPFGAETLAEERTRFRLWAPAAQRVDLELRTDDPERVLPMQRLEGGWYELVADNAPHGCRYTYRIDDRESVPDPASRYNPEDVHQASEVIAPATFDWDDGDWKGRPFQEVVLYELHVGTFTEAGTFAGVVDRLDDLTELGVTAIELMPVADFPGRRNWGYDGVLPFAPDARYGTPEDLKRLVQAAHRRGLMIFLDVVYNHFGPDGNYLHVYAPQFFSKCHHTPWGAAINFDGEMSHTVRDFDIHNALYWLEEFHFDGLRLDAVHAIVDDSRPDIVVEIAEAVRAGPGRERHVHLVLENDHNAARYLDCDANGRARWYNAQWNDDIHHALHVMVTGETDGHYGDYARKPAELLGRCLTEGFAYQGEPSPYRNGARRGEPSGHLPPTAFVSFLQNHDQVGNRAFGDRLAALADKARLQVATAVCLLAPSPPLLFMGEEFGCLQPFLYFCDFQGGLAEAVREGRRGEFARFERFNDAASRAAIPDPNDPQTAWRSTLDWRACERPPHREWRQFYRAMLALRRHEIIPRLYGISGGEGTVKVLNDCALEVGWTLGDGSRLHMVANFSAQKLHRQRPRGRLLTVVHTSEAALAQGTLAGPCAAWFLEETRGANAP